MNMLPRDRFQWILFLLFTAFFMGSCLNPPYLQFLLMQHVPTIVAIILLVYLANRFAISRSSFSMIIAFLTLHTLGARYLYSYVPYDDWCQRLLGFNLTESMGFQRNHYDRLVHFSYGLLLVIPIQEFERRQFGLSFGLASILAVECILATSAGYEILEWLVAVVFTPEWADKFLGQQGDMFDGQKDTALATAGALLTIGLQAVFQRRRSVNSDPLPSNRNAGSRAL